MRTVEELKAQHHLAAEVEASSHPEARARAGALRGQYYREQMAVLSEDVYEAARGEGASPTGWLRGSENLGELRRQMPQMAALDDKALLNMLKPGDSGFRADIYLPDATILGAGYQPTVVFKGSNGQVRLGDGSLRETNLEDFGANNFPQAIGLKTDYYDRAMFLARTLREQGASVDYAGHSLAGGMVSASVAVSGERGTTFNAAGLHPDTARRFQRENPDVTLYDTGNRIVAYQVRGEVLNDGLQNNVERMDVAQRRVLGAVLKETADLMQDIPQLQGALVRGLQSAQIPDHARQSITHFVEVLANGDAERMLRELPLAAGRVLPLEAKMLRDGQLVDRPVALPLNDLTDLAVPTLRAVRAVQSGAHAGHVAGEVVQASGEAAHRVLDASGDAVRAAGTLAATAAALKADVTAAARTGEGVFWQTVSSAAPDGSWLERFDQDRSDQTIQANLQSGRAGDDAAQAARASAHRDAASIRATGDALCPVIAEIVLYGKTWLPSCLKANPAFFAQET